MATRMAIIILILWISSVGVGCSSKAILPQDGPTMESVYDNHFRRIGRAGIDGARVRVGGKIHDEDADLRGYTREAKNELDVIFPRLPNPSLVMYVFPHLTERDRVPIPGYSTTFPMYTGVEYALPGEVPDQDPPAHPLIPTGDR